MGQCSQRRAFYDVPFSHRSHTHLNNQRVGQARFCRTGGRAREGEGDREWKERKEKRLEGSEHDKSDTYDTK